MSWKAHPGTPLRRICLNLYFDSTEVCAKKHEPVSGFQIPPWNGCPYSSLAVSLLRRNCKIPKKIPPEEGESINKNPSLGGGQNRSCGSNV